jgi:hypothetical protein
VSTRPQFDQLVREIVGYFKLAVEEQGLWRFLWYDGVPLAEKRVQDLFKLAASGWCRAYDVDMSPESNTGIGPVDFKFSQGWTRRTLVELKLASNTKFWSGLRKQLPQYMRSESIAEGYFIAICYTERDIARAREVARTAAKVSKALRYRITALTIDAQRDNKRSASKL